MRFGFAGFAHRLPCYRLYRLHAFRERQDDGGMHQAFDQQYKRGKGVSYHGASTHPAYCLLAEKLAALPGKCLILLGPISPPLRMKIVVADLPSLAESRLLACLIPVCARNIARLANRPFVCSVYQAV